MAPEPAPLVTPAELARWLAGDRPPVVLDVRWTLAGPDRPGYLAGHVPGAVFVDLDADLAAPVGDGSAGRHPLPADAELELVWRRAGIRDGDTVVVYDARDTSSAARAWWLLRWSGISRALVLDGGFAGWLAAGLPVDSGPAVDRRGDVTVRPAGMPTVDAHAAAQLGADGRLVDARAAARYRGEVEPIDPVAGHIPGAASLPLATLVDDSGRFRPAAELGALFQAAGIGPGDRAAAYCGSGVTACHLVLAGRVAGLELALYPGSWSQWCALGGPVERSVG
jgi:thiosulfate/3-mercaptopyruvate sulfurtransferase